MAMMEGFRVQNHRALRDVTLGKLSTDQRGDPLMPFTVVMGKNGSGKSTLFDAFGFVADLLLEDSSGAALMAHFIPKLLAGYGDTPGYDAVLVLVDTDDRNPATFRQELRGLLAACPRADKKALNRYTQDAVCGTQQGIADWVGVS